MLEQSNKHFSLKTLLSNTLPILCKNALKLPDIDFCIEALVGVTVGSGDDVVLVSIKEFISSNGSNVSYAWKMDKDVTSDNNKCPQANGSTSLNVCDLTNDDEDEESDDAYKSDNQDKHILSNSTNSSSINNNSNNNNHQMAVVKQEVHYVNINNMINVDNCNNNNNNNNNENFPRVNNINNISSSNRCNFVRNLCNNNNNNNNLIKYDNKDINYSHNYNNSNDDNDAMINGNNTTNNNCTTNYIKNEIIDDDEYDENQNNDDEDDNNDNLRQQQHYSNNNSFNNRKSFNCNFKYPRARGGPMRRFARGRQQQLRYHVSEFRQRQQQHQQQQQHAGSSYNEILNEMCQQVVDQSMSAEMQYVCHICQARRCSKSSLRNHIRGTHLAMDKYDCKICGEKFRWFMQLHRHRKKFHPYQENDVGGDGDGNDGGGQCGGYVESGADENCGGNNEDGGGYDDDRVGYLDPSVVGGLLDSFAGGSAGCNSGGGGGGY